MKNEARNENNNELNNKIKNAQNNITKFKSLLVIKKERQFCYMDYILYNNFIFLFKL